MLTVPPEQQVLALETPPCSRFGPPEHRFEHILIHSKTEQTPYIGGFSKQEVSNLQYKTS